MLAFLLWRCFMHSLQVEKVIHSVRLLLNTIMLVGVISTGVVKGFYEAVVAGTAAALVVAIMVATSAVLILNK